MIAALLAAAAVTWSPPQTLSAAEGRSLVPDLAVSPAGQAVAVWDHETGASCVDAPDSLGCIHTVEVVSRIGSDNVWGAPVALARPGVGATPRVSVNDAGRAAVIWVHDIGRDRVLQGTYRTGPTADFPNPNDLSAAVLAVRSHHVGLDTAGDVVAVWAERRVDTFAVAATVRNARTGTWGGQVTLSQRGVTSGPILAVTPAGEAFVVWMEENVVRAARGDIANDVWDPPVTLSRTFGEAGGEPDVAVNAAGDAAAVWTWHDRPRGSGIVQAAFRASGGEWSPVQDLGSAFGLAAQPAVALDPRGNALAVWRGDGGDLRAAEASRGSAWSRDVRVAGGAPADPDVVVADTGDALAGWRDAGSVVTSVRPAAAGAWQPAAVVAHGDAATPRIALDAAARGTAIWTAGPAASIIVQAADLTGDWRPSLTNVRAPTVHGRARVGGLLVCDRGVWDGTIPIVYSYRWLRNGHVIAAARKNSYRARRVDGGALVACRVTAVNAARRIAVTSRAVRVRD